MVAVVEAVPVLALVQAAPAPVPAAADRNNQALL